MSIKIGFLTLTILDLLDITLVWFAFYKIYKFFRGSMAARMMLGLLIIILFSIIADFVNLAGVSELLSILRPVWVIAIVIIFQPEFRRLLLYLGQNRVIQKLVRVQTPQFIEEVVSAVSELAKKNFGALIVLLRDTGIRGVVETGVKLQANVNKLLLLSIFNPRSPLHDGAVVIQGDVVLAATCQLPLTQNPALDPTLGMRHRAALGLSEQTDALVLIVSEETGTISLAENGSLIRGLSEEGLAKRLGEAFSPRAPKRRTLSDFLNLGE